MAEALNYLEDNYFPAWVPSDMRNVVDLSELASGIYFVKLNADDLNHSEKIVKLQ